MLRLNEVKAPLDHNEDVLIQAIVDKLSINRDELLGYTILSVVMMLVKKVIYY